MGSGTNYGTAQSGYESCAAYYCISFCFGQESPECLLPTQVPAVCVCASVCVCESLLDLMMHATDANHQFTQLSSASASASASASGSAPSSVCTPICWFILPLSRQRLLLLPLLPLQLLLSIGQWHFVCKTYQKLCLDSFRSVSLSLLFCVCS